MRIQAVTQKKPSWLAFYRKHSLETRLAAVIETATSAHLGALDDDYKATAKLYVQKAAQGAEEAWQHTIGGLEGRNVTTPTVSDLEQPAPPLRMKTRPIRDIVLSPPMESVPRRRGAPGVAEGTRQREVP